MEAIVVVVFFVCAVVFFMILGGKKLESRSVQSMLDEELEKYRSQFEQRARLSIKAGNQDKYQYYKKKIKDINDEIEKRKLGFSREEIRNLDEFLKKHVSLTLRLISERGYTEKQANNAILNEIESRRKKYENAGMTEQQALEKAGRDVYDMI